MLRAAVVGGLVILGLLLVLSLALDAVAVLRAHGADPNRVMFGLFGFTPCMYAAYCGRTACLRALAQGTARQEGRTLDVNAVATGGGFKGKTALDLALDQDKDEAAAYLRDELGALRAADLPPPRKPPKSAAKIPGGARKKKKKAPIELEPRTQFKRLRRARPRKAKKAAPKKAARKTGAKTSRKPVKKVAKAVPRKGL